MVRPTDARRSNTTRKVAMSQAAREHKKVIIHALLRPRMVHGPSRLAHTMEDRKVSFWQRFPKVPAWDPTIPHRLGQSFGIWVHEMWGGNDVKAIVGLGRRTVTVPETLTATMFSQRFLDNMDPEIRDASLSPTSTAAQRAFMLQLFAFTEDGKKWMEEQARLAALAHPSIRFRVVEGLISAVGTVFSGAYRFVLGSKSSDVGPRKLVSVFADIWRKKQERRRAMAKSNLRRNVVSLCHGLVNWGPRTLITWRKTEEVPAALRFRFSDMKRRDVLVAEEQSSSLRPLKRKRSLSEGHPSEDGQNKRRRLEY
ncbi:hypothetical protein ABKN59_001616 [Abortiporus biennis]